MKPVDADYTSVLVPLDGSELAELALAPGQALARRFGAALHVVVGDVQPDDRWWYEGYVDKLRQRTGGLAAHLSDEPTPATAIVAAARRLDPCVVCMATQGRSRSAAVVGSTFARVAARQATPLVAVGPRVVPTGEVDVPAGNLVVCLDGSPSAEQAVPLAAAWARRLGSDVSLVTAADPVLLPHEHGPDPDGYLRDVAKRLDLAGIDVQTKVLWGVAYPHILIGQYLDRKPADLLVATTRARTGFARAALGSEVARIIHRSPVPVLVQPLPHG